MSYLYNQQKQQLNAYFRPEGFIIDLEEVNSTKMRENMTYADELKERKKQFDENKFTALYHLAFITKKEWFSPELEYLYSIADKLLQKLSRQPDKPYTITVQIDKLSKEKWNKVIALCNHRIDTLEQLVAGSFPKELEVLFKERKYGLFPSPKEIHFDCSCPDLASMCKHVAAVLYGIGSRLDTNPMLFFELRDINSMELVKKSMENKLDNMLKNADRKSDRKIAEKDVFDLFGI